jgi:hypothetical protein
MALQDPPRHDQAIPQCVTVTIDDKDTRKIWEELRNNITTTDVRTLSGKISTYLHDTRYDLIGWRGTLFIAQWTEQGAS